MPDSECKSGLDNKGNALTVSDAANGDTKCHAEYVAIAKNTSAHECWKFFSANAFEDVG